MLKKILLFALLANAAYCGTVRLKNDSPFKLRAVIRGADGSYLGEMIVLPEHSATWSSDWQYYAENSNRTLTPYTVYWTCLDGGNFGIDTNVSTGGLSVAESSDGPRYCKPVKKKPESEADGPNATEEQLFNKNDAPGEGQTGAGSSTPSQR